MTRPGAGSTSSELSPSRGEMARWGLDPSWSRRVTFQGSDGSALSWHVLDTGPAPLGTILCVHGNPTWAYLWRDVLSTLSRDWRVIAVDQTGMGYSDRPGSRTLEDRIAELVAFARQEVTGELVLAAHDWGGPVALGAAASLEPRAVVLANTAVALPGGLRVPPLIALAKGSTDFICRRTPLFVDMAAAAAPRDCREALRAPYRTARRRQAIADFVTDIPVRPGDPSWATLDTCASSLARLDCPVLLLWGGGDPVFHDRFLRDLIARVPHADVHRFANAGHFVCLEQPIGKVIGTWLDTSRDPPSKICASELGATTPPRSILAELRERSSDSSTVYEGPDGVLTWADLSRRSARAAATLQRHGLRAGDRVSLLISPGVELLIAAMATWQAGGVCVVADSSSGLRTLRALVRAAAPSWVIGSPAALGVATIGGFAPGARRCAFASLAGAIDLRESSDAVLVPATVHESDVAAIVHTSGATGAAKPVRYTHATLWAQRRALTELLATTPGESFTTSFAPFMLLAPLLGLRCVRPDFDLNRPSELTFDALAAAVQRSQVTTAWLSPAAASSVVASASARRLALRLVLLAGAPIPAALARQVGEVTGAEVRAPYGMTECLPVTDGVDPLATGPIGGTSTGRALDGCVVTVTALDDPEGPALRDGHWGEILVSAPWMFSGYDHRWGLDAASNVMRAGQRFHRTGDVGYLFEGRLFQLGRAQHVLRTAQRDVACIEVEEPVTDAIGQSVAAVAVGPTGAAVVVIVVSAEGHLRLAPEEVAAAVRSASRHRVAAVLVGRLPTDRRHQSKIDRVSLARAAASFLAGR